MPHMIAADVARQICIGLDYAHTLRGPDGEPLEIVHQDISPTNIMLAFTGTVKILDFGIARAAEFAEEEAKKGLIKGKVSYLSPEQIYVRPFDARADMFALGVVFHEMLTGRRLFQSTNDITKMRELLAAPILPPSAIDAMIPRELDRIVMRVAGDRSEGSLPERGRHGGRPGAHADRGALLQPRAVEDAARAVHGRRTSRWWSSTRATTRRHLDRPSPSRRRSTLPPAEQHDGRHGSRTRKRRRRGWTACCAPSARAWSGCAGARALKVDVRRRWSWPWRSARSPSRPKKYLPELREAVGAAPPPTPVMKNQEADAAAAAGGEAAAAPRRPGERGQEAARATRQGRRAHARRDAERRPCRRTTAEAAAGRAQMTAVACASRRKRRLLEAVDRDRQLGQRRLRASASLALSLSITSSGARDR